MHNENIYPEPQEFKPERHLVNEDGGEPQMDPTEFVFGFGRRVCPGMFYNAFTQGILVYSSFANLNFEFKFSGEYFARCSLFLTVTSVLSCFNISKVLDADGKEVTPEVAFTTGTTRCV